MYKIEYVCVLIDFHYSNLNLRMGYIVEFK